ncbi:protein-glutamate methylesterase/protein-glutamine glutaminase [Cytobacillus kochii]
MGVSKIKVVVIDDSAFMRKLITDFLSGDPLIEVIGVARNGEEGVREVIQKQPDVVTLDIEMPIMNGLEALQKIMANKPLPVIMLSSAAKVSTDHTILAFKYGAFDFIEKPSGPISLDLYKIKHDLIEKVKIARQTNMKSLISPINQPHKNIKTSVGYSNIELKGEHLVLREKKPLLVTIAASTGGPRAIQSILQSFPQDINATILIVQHMPPYFTHSLANRLNQMTHITVKEVEDGEKLEKGVAYIAKGGLHFTINQKGSFLFAHLLPPEKKVGHCPSADMLFASFSELQGYRQVAVVLTGMGVDGKKGAQKLKEKTKTTIIAESKETAIVYGMPKAIVDNGLADEVVELQNVSSTILKYV